MSASDDPHRQHALRVEAGVDGPQRHQAAQHHRGAHQQDDGQRHLAHDEQASGADPEGGIAASALLERVGQLAAPGAEGRQRPGEEAGQDRGRERERRAREVHGDLVGARHLVGQHRRERTQAGVGEQHAGGASGARQDQRLDQELLEDAGAPGAQGRPRRELLAAAERPREQQVAHVRAGDEQHQPDGRQQQHQRRAHVADDHVPQRSERGAPAGVVLRMLLLEPLRDHLELGQGLGERRPGASRAIACCVVVLAHGTVSASVSASGTQISREAANHEPSEKACGMTPTIA